jgi:AcrR family transcriptional regulator
MTLDLLGKLTDTTCIGSCHTRFVSLSDGAGVRSIRRAERRESLVAAAVDAIEMRGANIGVDEIAEHCGLARPLLYRYFSGLIDLQRSILNYAAGDLLGEMSRLGDDPNGDLRSIVVEAVSAYLGWVFAHPNLSRYCLQIAPAGGDINGLRTQIREILSALVIPHIFGEHSDEAAAPTFIAALAGVAEGTAVWWLDSDATIALEHLTSDLARRIQTLIDAEITHLRQRTPRQRRGRASTRSNLYEKD